MSCDSHKVPFFCTPFASVYATIYHGFFKIFMYNRKGKKDKAIISHKNAWALH